MAEGWHQCADGTQIKVPQNQQRAGTGALARGCVPVQGFVLVSAQTLASDGRISIGAGDATFADCAPNDPVIVEPAVTDPSQTPGDELYGLTIGPCSVTSPGLLRVILQNRTAGNIVIAADFWLSVTVLHILPEPAEVP